MTTWLPGTLSIHTAALAFQRDSCFTFCQAAVICEDTVLLLSDRGDKRSELSSRGLGSDLGSIV